MNDGIRINNKHSYHDFGLYIKTRNVSLPEKKSIRQTVPFMSGYYDFTALNGAPAWDERTIEYSFDVIAPTPQELEREMTKIIDWACNAHEVDIYDDVMVGYHWRGSYESSSIAWDDSGQQAELSLSFVVHPFKIADMPTKYNMKAGTYKIENLGMTVAPIAYCETSAAIQIGTYVTAIPAGEVVTLEIDLERGENTVVVTGDGTVEFSFFREVL